MSLCSRAHISMTVYHDVITMLIQYQPVSVTTPRVHNANGALILGETCAVRRILIPCICNGLWPAEMLLYSLHYC